MCPNVDDHGLEVLKKAAQDIGATPKTDYALQTIDVRKTIVSTENSSTTALSPSQTFTGEWESSLNYNCLTVGIKTDKAGVLYIEFSPDGVNNDSIIEFDIEAETNEVHRVTITRKYFRVRFTNTNGSTQTYFRMQTILGDQPILSSALNSVVQQDSDAIVARVIDAEIAIAQGLFQGYSIVNKVGLNPSIDGATVPEDIWGNGGVYTGWAATAQTLEVFSSAAADNSGGTGARTVFIQGLDANYNLLTETVTLNGITPVLTTGSFLRCHTMRVQTAGTGGVNAGTITVRQSTTTANIMLFMRIGLNQTNDGVYTIPAGFTGYLVNMHACVRGNSGSIISAGIWTRSFGSVFRQRRPFSCSQSAQYVDSIYGGLSFTEKTDLTYRCDASSGNNAEVVVSFDIILVRN